MLQRHLFQRLKLQRVPQERERNRKLGRSSVQQTFLLLHFLPLHFLLLLFLPLHFLLLLFLLRHFLLRHFLLRHFLLRHFLLLRRLLPLLFLLQPLHLRQQFQAQLLLPPRPRHLQPRRLSLLERPSLQRLLPREQQQFAITNCLAMAGP
eukprot:PhF_6_TR6886/c0_g2_i13/m.9954